jgi:protein-tyrosine phosphatase
VLFVCKGNLYRSPFAHHLAARVFPAGVQAASAGYHPEAGRTCAPAAVQAAADMGVDLGSHRSQVLSDAVVHDADVIFVFDHDNYLTLRRRYPAARARVHYLGILGDHRDVSIRDPAGGGPADIRAVYETIRRRVLSASVWTPRPSGDS